MQIIDNFSLEWDKVGSKQLQQQQQSNIDPSKSDRFMNLVNERFSCLLHPKEFLSSKSTVLQGVNLTKSDAFTLKELQLRDCEHGFVLNM